MTPGEFFDKFYNYSFFALASPGIVALVAVFGHWPALVAFVVVAIIQFRMSGPLETQVIKNLSKE